jgi:hypothetical protein
VQARVLRGRTAWPVVGAYLVLTAATAVVAYLRTFSANPNGDEAYLLVSLRSFVDGGTLYADVFTQYGPFYYLFFGGLFEASGRLISLDAGRALTVLVWVVSALLLGLAAHRLTGRWLLGLATQLVAFNIGFALAPAPMHPVGITALLLAVIAVVLAFVVPQRPALGLALMGALGACLALVKINVGGFVLIALAFAVATCMTGPGRTALARRALVALAVATPVLVMAADLGDAWAQTYALVVLLAMLAVAAMTVEVGPDLPPGVGVRLLGSLVAGAAGATVVVVVATLMTGVSPADLFRGVVIDPMDQREVFRLPVILKDLIIPWAFVLVVTAFVVRGLRDVVTVPLLVSAGLRLLAGLLTWLGLVRLGLDLDIGPQFDGAFALPALLAWVAAIPPGGVTTTVPERIVRAGLPALAVLQTLHGYPVGGPQRHIGALLCAVTGAICLADALTQLRAWAAARPAERAHTGRVLARTAAAGLLGMLVFAYVIRPAGDWRRAYAEGEPLPFATANQMRLPQAQVDTYRQIVDALKANCPTFVTLPGLNEFYLWSGIKPPTGLNTTHWLALLDTAEQQRVVDAIDGKPACVLANQGELDFWLQGQPPPRRPLVAYIDEQFEPSLTFGAYELRIRKGPSAPAKDGEQRGSGGPDAPSE